MISYKGLVIIWLSIAIFTRGLYFIHEVAILLLIGILLLTWIWMNERIIYIPKDWVSLFLLTNLIIQCFGYIFYIEKGMLFDSITRSVLYLVAYLLVNQIIDKTFINRFKWTFILLISVGGFISTLSYLFQQDTWLNYVINQRVAGPLQYANTNAILILVALIIFIQLKMKDRYRVIGVILLTIPFVLSMSRASFIIGILALATQIILIKNGRLKVVLSLLVGTGIGWVIIKLLASKEALDRIGTLNITASEWQTRLLYYKDAFFMIKAKPLGYGSYGYMYAQKAFQTGSLYHVKFVHSSLIQAFIDRGLLGGVILGIFMIYVVAIRKYEFKQRLLVIVLLGHSLIDVDLQFSYIWILIIVLLMKENSEKLWKLKWKLKYILVSLFIGIISLYVLAVSLLYTGKRYKEVLNIYPYHTESIRKVIKKMPLDKESVNMAYELIERNPFIIESYEVLLDFNRKNEKILEMVEYARKYTEYKPLDINGYEIYAEVLLSGAKVEIEQKHEEKARKYIEELVLLPEKIKTLAKEKNTDYNVKHKPMLKMTNSMWAIYEQGKLLLEELDNKK